MVLALVRVPKTKEMVLLQALTRGRGIRFDRISLVFGTLPRSVRGMLGAAPAERSTSLVP